jgi:hypothetical protein
VLTCGLTLAIKNMNSAKFVNFSTEDFTGYWDGRPRIIKAGESIFLPAFLAKHYAKHLVNRELIRKDSSGNEIYKNGEKMTSPKKPEDVPMYMALFNKAVFEISTEVEEGNTEEQVEVMEKNEEVKEIKKKGRPKKVVEDEDEFQDIPE